MRSQVTRLPPQSTAGAPTTSGARRPREASGQQRPYRLPLTELDRAADRRDVLFAGVEAERREHGGVHVGNRQRVDRVLQALRVGRADDLAPADAAAGQGEAEAVRPV